MRDGVHYQYERHDGRGPAFARYAEMIPRPAKILHLARALGEGVRIDPHSALN